MQMSQMNRAVLKRTREQSITYLDNLFYVMNSSVRKDLNIVLFDTVHHYAAASSLLLERGLVDRVVFSQYDSGAPLDEEQFAFPGTKNIFVAGGYNRLCLASSSSYIKKNNFKKNIFAIKDMIINPPQDHLFSIKPKTIDRILPEHTITLKDLEGIRNGRYTTIPKSKKYARKIA